MIHLMELMEGKYLKNTFKKMGGYFGIPLICLMVLLCMINDIFNRTYGRYYREQLSKQYSSKNGDLLIIVRNKCSISEYSGKYFFKNNVRFSGGLTRTNCSQDINAERIEYKFTDIEGDEFCYGRMIKIESGQKNVTIWKIEGSVSGHYCSHIGANFEVEMKKGIRMP
jgi:hypothetical protein